ncbi:RNA polymerase II transcription elongation factor-domain-containing protein [Clohesyomyces aquaticus]|uniref:RNA polymerase II transcription elongation factor-domain-containing protein n=1 Tax=Clohesyomyces aquaticus TaxID=1231657 RepID=A0A1Y1ZUV7_9PLEO|nr:RNA polymerase II transcription elongation factor-domain-containing protein [Clohesyomyces aquaticus]
MLDSRSPRVLDPHKKAHFSLHISDRITKSDNSAPSYSAVKYNHKPPQTSSTRTTTLTSSTNDTYKLRLEDKDVGKDSDIFTFTGQRTVPKKSYILLFDQSSQKCTLEPLSSSYTFNLQSHNAANVSSTHTKIYPRKSKDDNADTGRAAGAESDDLFDANPDDADDEPDPNNPYDFRHFLKKDKDKEKRGYDSESQFQSSPDYRTGTGSAYNTPVLPASRKPLSSTTSKSTSAKPKPTSQPTPAAKPKPRKRKSPDADPMLQRKPTTTKKQTQSAPSVRLDRAASTHTKPSTKPATNTRKPASKPTNPSSKIKSAEIVHSSSESDADADGESDSPDHPAITHALPVSPPTQPTRYADDSDSDSSDADADDHDTGLLEIEVPDSHSRPTKPKALSSLGLGQTLGLGGSHLSPARNRNGPISLASAANSVEGSPNPGVGAFGTPRKAGAGARQVYQNKDDDEDVIDFGNLGGGAADSEEEEEEEDGGYVEDREDEDDADADADADVEMEDVGGGIEDRDVEPMDLGPPAQTNANGHDRKMSLGTALTAALGGDADGEEEDEEDPLYKEMMQGLAGESSEESEEE